MIETDRAIVEAFINREFSQPVSTADVTRSSGRRSTGGRPAGKSSSAGPQRSGCRSTSPRRGTLRWG
jgi:hypothetical protein